MKIFLDTAHQDQIRKYSPIIDGVTTNPSLIAKEKGVSGYHGMIQEICDLVHGPVSAEVLSEEWEGMVQEAQTLSGLSPHVVVKIPIGMEGLYAIRELSILGIKTNATLIFSVNQALLAAKAGATYLSIFVGRLDDIGQNGMEVVRDTVQVVRQSGFSSEVLSASIRHPQHMMEAAKAGSHVATVPPAVLEQMVQHPLTDIGLEKFMKDWRSAGNNL